MLHSSIEIRSDFGAPSLAGEQRLEIRESDIIRPPIGAGFYIVAALVVAAINQQIANPHSTHFAQRDLLRALHPDFGFLTRLMYERPGTGRQTLPGRSEASGPVRCIVEEAPALRLPRRRKPILPKR